jgi:SpoVK/Ycf46/Vps4 family AAA+-type ATPase
MSIDRISNIFSKPSGNRIKVIYGPGIEDIFINRNLFELRFEEALYEELRRQGYDRIVFFSPHRSIFFLDRNSQELSRPEPLISAENGESQFGQLSLGPLNDLKIFQPSIPVSTKNHRNVMGDVFAVRMLDKMMHQNDNIRSAIVILQSETVLRYFEDQRTLAGLVGDWMRLPAQNHNDCFFVFSISDEAKLLEIASGILIPELRNIIYSTNNNLNHNFDSILISSPEIREIRYLIFLNQQRNNFAINEKELEKLCQRMAAEGKLNRFWSDQLQQIQRLDYETARNKSWFQAVQDPDSSVWDRLNNLTGLETVKVRVHELASYYEVLKRRQRNAKKKEKIPNLHMVFTGNPGTGKTTVARLFGEIFHEIGLLKRGHLVEVKVSDLVADYVGGTAIKTNSVIDRAVDGVLFIDEAYALTEEGRGGYGSESLEAILTRLEDDRDKLVVIIAGYPEKMSHFLHSNPGLKRRFPSENLIHFDDFDQNELTKILLDQLIFRELTLTDDFTTILASLVNQLWIKRDEMFGNAGEMRNLAEGIDRCHANRSISAQIDISEPLTIEDIPPSYKHYLPQTVSEHEEIFTELDELVGLANVKDFLKTLTYRLEFENLRYQDNSNLNNKPRINHMVFKGNPGTGKTTVARLIGKIYQSLGILRQGHVVEVTRVDLVAGYVGQTAQKTLEKVKSALDGILFIDEAYTLANDGNQGFGQEAIDTLVKVIETYQNRLVVILAGYPEEIDLLLSTNPGLYSRFSIQLDFQDLNTTELVDILKFHIQRDGFTVSDIKVFTKSEDYFKQAKVRQQKYFGNGRFVLSFYELVKTRLANRVIPLVKSLGPTEISNILNTILPEDVPEPESYFLDPFHPIMSSINNRQI